MSIRSGQITKKKITGLFLNKQKPLLSFVSNQPRCQGNSTHLNQTARVNPSVVNLVDSFKIQRKSIGIRLRHLKTMIGHLNTDEIAAQ